MRGFAVYRVVVSSFVILSFSGVAGAQSHGSAELLVANQKDHTLSIVDPIAGNQVAAIPENRITGHEVIASPDGRKAYVPVYGDSGVGRAGTDGREMLVIDLPSRKITSVVDFGHGVRPHCPKFDRVHGLLYVTTELDQTVSVIDPHSLKIVGTVPTGQSESHMLVLSRDGNRGYTANVGPGTISVLDMRARKLLKVIPISPKIQRIALSMDDARIFTSDVTQPRLAVVRADTGKIEKWIPLPAPGYGSAPTPDGKLLVLAVPSAGKVVAIDLASLTVVRSVDVPSAPQEVLIRPDGKVAYISCNVSHKVAVVDLADWKVQKIIEAGNGADGLAWAESPSGAVASR